MRTRAVTLLELLVALGVIAALLSIFLVAARVQFDRARGVDDLQRLRSIHLQFFAWGADRNDRFVNQGPPSGSGEFVLRLRQGGGSIHSSYFIQSDYWTWVLASDLGRGERAWHPRSDESDPPSPRLVPDMPGRDFIRPSFFRYSLAMLVDPAFWTYPSCNYQPEVKRGFYRFVRWSETAHPSAKALHFDSAALENSGGVSAPVSFVDGSADTLAWSNAVRDDSGDCPSAAPVEATPRGVLGRDFNR